MSAKNFKQRAIEKRDKIKSYDFSLEQLAELLATNDLYRESENEIEGFSFTKELVKTGFGIDTEYYVLCEKVEGFRPYNETSPELNENPYFYLSKELSDKLIEGKTLTQHGDLFVPLIGKESIKKQTNFPSNKKLIVGAIKVKQNDVPIDIEYFEKLGKISGTTYHHVFLTRHNKKLTDRYELMLNCAAHDLQEPAISAYSQIRGSQKVLKKLLDKYQANSELESELKSLESFLNKAARFSKFISFNLEDYLFGATLKEKEIHLNMKEFNAYNEIFSLIYDLFEGKALKRGITLDNTLDGISRDTIIYGDATKLANVFNNLVSNAIKYGDQNGSFALGYEIHPNEHRFIVWNRGPKIPDEYADKIFDKWERIPGTKVEGTGLGLANAKSIVLAHKGKIWQEYRTDGPAFIVALPRTYKL